MKRGTLLGAAISFSLLLGACDNMGVREAKAEPKTHQVVISKFLFGPDTITVNVGDSIEWVNKDFVPHTATEISADWDTTQLNKNEAKSLIFSNPGEFDYICAYHPEMHGKVIVKAD
ncbi:MAG: cupredoxin family copper-binding protein [Sphingomonadales bacterium]|jgi:plastocyanin